MKTATITVELLSWWHAGSGLGRGGDADALVIRDRDGLPYLPGKTLKGLLRDAVQLAEDHGHLTAKTTETIFGPNDPTTRDPRGQHAEYDATPRDPGQITVTNATLPKDLADWLRAGGEARKAALFEAVTSTALNEDGVVRNKTLRTVEVCPPLALTATLSGPDNGVWFETIKQCVPLIRALGSHRHRGLGRCQVTLPEKPTDANAGTGVPLPPDAVASGCVWLDIKLQSDVIASQSAATTGGHDSLDYLPGSVLLGAAAARLFKQPGFGPEVFLSGKVRFGDGLPLAPDGCLGRPVPLNCFFTKQDGPTGPAINGLTDTRKAEEERVRSKRQAQQLRTGHLTHCGVRFDLEGDYLLKTALDRGKLGRARDRQLFEYETLPAGSRFRTAIHWDAKDPTLTAKVAEIVRVLTGSGVALGRSRRAQFGQVEIKLASHPGDEPQSLDDGVAANEPDAPEHPLHFYLLSDLALARPGGARLIPEANDFGLGPEWRFHPERSFLRTRRWSPWNAFHHTRLTERQVIGRGSVLTFARADQKPATASELEAVRNHLAQGVGEHREEGLGWVQLNPDFVLKLPELKRAPTASVPSPRPNPAPPDAHKLLCEWVSRRQNQRDEQTEALKVGQQWAETWLPWHKKAAKGERLGRSGRSQWNEVRQRAIRARGDVGKLRELLAEQCERGLRRKYWLHDDGHPPLWKALQDALATAQGRSGSFACAAIAAAAETIVRRLQSPEDRP
jgi:CRISPR/Cas system CSM-associated protein Csm3 (group 7 of RAMP superfamily)